MTRTSHFVIVANQGKRKPSEEEGFERVRERESEMKRRNGAFLFWLRRTRLVACSILGKEDTPLCLYWMGN